MDADEAIDVESFTGLASLRDTEVHESVSGVFRTLVRVTLDGFVAGLCEVKQRVSCSNTWQGRLCGAFVDETTRQSRTYEVI